MDRYSGAQMDRYSGAQFTSIVMFYLISRYSSVKVHFQLLQKVIQCNYTVNYL